jgi:hypothetical protein
MKREEDTRQHQSSKTRAASFVKSKKFKLIPDKSDMIIEVG